MTDDQTELRVAASVRDRAASVEAAWVALAEIQAARLAIEKRIQFLMTTKDKALL